MIIVLNHDYRFGNNLIHLQCHTKGEQRVAWIECIDSNKIISLELSRCTRDFAGLADSESYLLMIEVLAAMIRRLVRLFGGPSSEPLWWWIGGGFACFIIVPFTSLISFASSVVPPAEFSLPFATTFAFFTICTTLVLSQSRFSESSSSDTDSLFTRSNEVPSLFAEPFDEVAALLAELLVELEPFEDPLFALTIKLLLLLRVFTA